MTANSFGMPRKRQRVLPRLPFAVFPLVPLCQHVNLVPLQWLLTCPAISNGRIQAGHKVRHNAIHLVQPCKNIYDVGTGIVVFLRENCSKENCYGLLCQFCRTRKGLVLTSRAFASAGALPARMQPTARVNNCCVCACCEVC